MFNVHVITSLNLECSSLISMHAAQNIRHTEKAIPKNCFISPPNFHLSFRQVLVCLVAVPRLNWLMGKKTLNRSWNKTRSSHLNKSHWKTDKKKKFSTMEPNPSSSMHSYCLEISPMEVHKVVPPPHRSTLQKLKTRLKETFFPDDPLRQFKGQPLNKQWILAAQYFFPILQWGPNYNLKLFKSDIVSGLTIASLAIPQVDYQSNVFCFCFCLPWFLCTCIRKNRKVFLFWTSLFYPFKNFLSGYQLRQAC